MGGRFGKHLLVVGILLLVLLGAVVIFFGANIFSIVSATLNGGTVWAPGWHEESEYTEEIAEIPDNRWNAFLAREDVQHSIATLEDLPMTGEPDKEPPLLISEAFHFLDTVLKRYPHLKQNITDDELRDIKRLVSYDLDDSYYKGYTVSAENELNMILHVARPPLTQEQIARIEAENIQARENLTMVTGEETFIIGGREYTEEEIYGMKPEEKNKLYEQFKKEQGIE